MQCQVDLLSLSAPGLSVSQTDYLPFNTPHPLIRSNSRCFNQVQSLNSSHCLKKLYICSSSESGECPRANPSCSPPKMTHSVSDTVFMGRGYKRDMGSKPPLLMLGLLFLGGRFVPRDHVLSFRVQEEYKRF